MNKQDNVPQVKTVEGTSPDAIVQYVNHFYSNLTNEGRMKVCVDVAQRQQSDRIAELEAALKYSELQFQIACEVMDERIHEWTRRINQAEQDLNIKCPHIGSVWLSNESLRCKDCGETYLDEPKP